MSSAHALAGIPSCCSRLAKPAFRCRPLLWKKVVTAWVITVTAMLNSNTTVVAPIRMSRVLSMDRLHGDRSHLQPPPHSPPQFTIFRIVALFRVDWRSNYSHKVQMSSVNMERTRMVVTSDPFVPFQLLFWVLLDLLVLRARQRFTVPRERGRITEVVAIRVNGKPFAMWV